jgi:hypothetical protein
MAPYRARTRDLGRHDGRAARCDAGVHATRAGVLNPYGERLCSSGRAMDLAERYAGDGESAEAIRRGSTAHCTQREPTVATAARSLSGSA